MKSGYCNEKSEANDCSITLCSVYDTRCNDTIDGHSYSCRSFSENGVDCRHLHGKHLN